MFLQVQESLVVVEVFIQVVYFLVVMVFQEWVQVVFKKMVQGVFQFVVCDMIMVGQLVKDGVIQVVVSEEGVVYMVVGEGVQIIMQEVQGEYMDLVELDGEILQIIVMEELVQVMVQEFSGGFFEGVMYYIVIELFLGVQDELGLYFYVVLEIVDLQEFLQVGVMLGMEVGVLSRVEQLVSVVIYIQEGFLVVVVIQS